MENKRKLSPNAPARRTFAKSKSRLAVSIKSELVREPKRGKLTLPQLAKRGLVWFFAVMLALTFISRAANEALVARVTVKSVSGGILDQSIEGSGVWTAEDTVPQHDGFSGLRIARVYVQAGDEVQAGQALYAYDTAAIADTLKALSGKLEQYELQIKELKLGRGDTADSAAFSLSQAERDLAIANGKLNGGTSDVAAAKRKAYEDALFAYQTETALSDSQLAAAKQAVAAAQAALDPADPKTQAALDEAQAALGALSAQWDYTLSGPRRTLDKAQDEWTRVQNGTYDYTAEFASYRDAVASAERALEAARFNYERAKDNDGDTNANVAYQIDAVELSMKAEQEKYDELAALLEREGEVYSAVAGVVTAVSAAAGEPSSDQAAVSISAGALALKLELPSKQANTLAIGDAVSLVKDGRATGDRLTLSKIGIPDANGVCTILCTGDSGIKRALGAPQAYAIEKKTDKQNIRVPLSALREDGNGSYFVLVIGSRDTVLGEQAVAACADVTLIGHDSQYAAVDGGLSGSDRVIVSSNKNISAGDRVVIDDA